MSLGKIKGSNQKGFTLVEVMFVVVIIGILNAIALPTIAHVQREAQAHRLANDFRVIRDSIEFALSELGTPPPDGFPGRHPRELIPYLPREAMRTSITRAQWDWENWIGMRRNFELGMTLRMRHGLENDPLMQRVDEIMDDGDLNTGFFQRERHFGGYAIIFQ